MPRPTNKINHFNCQKLYSEIYECNFVHPPLKSVNKILSLIRWIGADHTIKWCNTYLCNTLFGKYDIILWRDTHVLTDKRETFVHSLEMYTVLWCIWEVCTENNRNTKHKKSRKLYLPIWTLLDDCDAKGALGPHPDLCLLYKKPKNKIFCSVLKWST